MGQDLLQRREPPGGVGNTPRSLDVVAWPGRDSPAPREQISPNPIDSILSRLANPGPILPMHGTGKRVAEDLRRNPYGLLGCLTLFG